MHPAEQQMQFVFTLRSHGVTNAEVLKAMEATPRAAFLEGIFAERAFEDMALPIACGQTISQPSVVGLMTQALDVTRRCKVLEIGTGSGYQAAVLSHLCSHVYTVERWRELQKAADRRFAELGITNVTTIIGDGWLGWPPKAPYDRIIVTAAAPEAPKALVAQLKVGGRMLVPLGETRDTQQLVQIDKKEAGITQAALLPVRFVPLLHGRVKPAERA